MAVQPPDRTELLRITERYGLGLADDDLASFAPVVGGLLSSWDVVEELYAQSAPTAPERAWTRPEGADNPYDAWYGTTDVPGSGQGPLAGRRVAVKDNTMVAGVPMMNGSATVEGFVPTRDATVSHGCSRRARRCRQGRLRGPVLLRRLAHLAHRPGPRSVGRDPLGRRVVVGQRGARGRRARRPRHRR